MTAAMTAGAQSAQSSLDLLELRREVVQLRLTLMGLKSDIDEARGPIRTPALNTDLERGINRALRSVDDIRRRLGG